MRARQFGFSYVVVMFLVAIASIVSLRALEGMRVSEQREKEAELLWRGMAYRDAIKSYYVNSLGGGAVSPAGLNDLLDDGRFSNAQRHLRKLYRDPMTADGKWGLLHNADGQLIGVYSLSPMKPMKQAGFPEGLEAFTNAAHYSDWQFVYQPH